MKLHCKIVLGASVICPVDNHKANSLFEALRSYTRPNTNDFITVHIWEFSLENLLYHFLV